MQKKRDQYGQKMAKKAIKIYQKEKQKGALKKLYALTDLSTLL